MLGPQHYPLLLRYLDGIDLCLALQLLRPTPATETTLTQSLGALMDAATQRREELPRFNIDHLNAALAAQGDNLQADIRIDTRPHSAHFEANVSQSDFGLVLEYQNLSDSRFNWIAAYLMQAKRLFPAKSGEYDLTSGFDSANTEQHQRLRDLVGELGEEVVKYIFYCPPVSGFTANAEAAIRTFHNFAFGEMIFDYALGLALRDAVRDKPGVNAGMWLSGTDIPPQDTFSFHQSAFTRVHPFSWFVLSHFQSRSPLRHQIRDFGGALNIDSGGGNASVSRARGVIDGDPTACRALIDALGERARRAGLDTEKVKPLPASSVTITIRAGSEADRRYS
ncbi:hypothetical protein GVM20_15660 [Porphyrobacter sp. SLTP]|uniref:hypothetical protein n=1 Tax=Porphyrobacter sp. SLTP TaxID=2683266 RepID=UPI00141281C7|nr:hypothetical protein [Porphyrobacter sp. SLTP]NBB26569.1 hypothetical protein [Porphyrobacter sp. SLTP]